jgi:uncharacterized protein (DUF1501 family)
MKKPINFLMNPSRRDVMRAGFRSLGTLSLAAGLNQILRMPANAQTVAGYRGLVCIFLFGGNDSNNLIIPLGVNEYGQYASLRGALALPQTGVLPISGGGATYGLHAAMPNVRTLYQQGKAAGVLNVGMLVKPLTKSEANAGGAMVPSNLYSHSDQQMQWQAAPTLTTGRSGWGGRAVDVIQSLQAPPSFPIGISTGGNSIFLQGKNSTPGTVNGGLGLGLDASDGGPRDASFEQILTFDSGMSLVQTANQITGRGIAVGKQLNQILNSGTPLTTVFPNSGLADQLSQVARIMRVRTQLGMTRQIFFCSQGGYDTHGDQLPRHQQLLAELDAAINAFYSATLEMGIQNDVITFTESEFNRTYTPNSNAGSDHAWGGNQIVVGGSVKGGIYGRPPVLDVRGSESVGDRGLWIPSSGLDQFGATLASWFGVPDSSLETVFPNLVNFTTKKLGFA